MTPREYGREFAKGCADVIIFILFIVVLSNFIISLLSPNRTEVEIITDAKTGHQYLATQKGGIVIRQDGGK